MNASLMDAKYSGMWKAIDYVPVYFPPREARALAIYLRRVCFTNLDFYSMREQDISYLRLAFDIIYRDVTEKIGPIMGV